jgi:hypothetical protein
MHHAEAVTSVCHESVSYTALIRYAPVLYLVRQIIRLAYESNRGSSVYDLLGPIPPMVNQVTFT